MPNFNAAPKMNFEAEAPKFVTPDDKEGSIINLQIKRNVEDISKDIEVITNIDKNKAAEKLQNPEVKNSFINKVKQLQKYLPALGFGILAVGSAGFIDIDKIESSTFDAMTIADVASIIAPISAMLSIFSGVMAKEIFGKKEQAKV